MKTIVMCIGNINGGDDAVGPYIANQLKKENFDVIDSGVIPENYTSVVKKKNPDELIIIDAIDMGLKPGETRIVPKDKIGLFHISTHGIPISVLIGYLENYVKKIIFIGVQPKSMSGKITSIVKKNADHVVNLIKNKEIHRLKILN